MPTAKATTNVASKSFGATTQSKSSDSFQIDGTKIAHTSSNITATNVSAALEEVATQLAISTGEPSAPSEGDIWYDTDDNLLYVRVDSAWKQVYPVSLNDLGTETSIASGDFISMVDITDNGSGKITLANFQGYLTGTGALNSGSITSGFGAIDIGSSALTAGSTSLSALSLLDGNITNVGSIQLDSIAGDGDTNTSIEFSGSDVITVSTGGETQVTFNNGSILPTTDNDVDLGSSSYEFKDGYFDGTVYADAINFNGTAIGSTAAELNLLDGSAKSTSSITIADADAFIVIDGTTTKQIPASDLETYMESSLDTLSNVTTVGTLNSGAISSGFGAIDIGSSGLTAGATQVSSLSILDGNITNAGDINCDSISIDDAAVGLNIDFGGNTTLNKITLTDNLADALNITESSNSYLKFVTSNSGEKITLGKKLEAGSVEIEGSAFDIDGGDISAATISGGLTWSSAQNLNSQNLTNVNIDSGTVDGADVTVGSGKTLDVSGGTLTLANDQISGDKVSGGTIGTTTITALAGALSLGDNNITNVSDIALDSISADATDINVAVSDNSATAFTIKQGSDAYLVIDTANSSESVAIGTGISGTGITIGHSTSETTVADNLTVTGNLKVNGDTVTQNVSTMTVNDPIISLQTADDGANLGSDTNKDVGLAMFYHTGSAAKTAFLGWDDSAGKLTFVPDASISSEVVSGSVGTIVADLEGDVTGNVSGTAATVTGAAQSNITSLGTLTTLTVDNVIINATTIGHTSDTDLMTLADGVLTVAGEVSMTTLDIGGTNVTSTAAELNLIDGGTARGTTAVASGDGILINDGGTMRMTNVDTVSTYFASHNVGGGNIVTTGDLNSGSITSGFGSINTGSSTITTTGLISGGSLDIDDVLINGTTIGHTDDTDLMTLADGVLTVAGEVDATSLDVSGNADIDGTLEADAITVDGTALATYIRDTVGTNMVSSNTETGITVTYDTSNDNLDFAIDAAQTVITSLLATDIKIGEDDQTKIDFETADEIHFYANNTEQVYLADNIFGPQSDSDVDLGTTGVRWKDAFVDSITVTGEVDGASLDISGNADIDGTLEADAITVDGTALNEYIADTVGAMVGSNTESGITVAYQDADNTLDFTVGTLNQDTSGTAAIATTVTITDNESTDEDNAVVFTSGGDVDGGNLGLESDGHLTYNPSTGRLTATQLAGTLQTAAQTNITSVGTIGTGTWEATDVAVAHGGTGASTLTANGVLIGNGTSAVTAVDLSTKGKILIGDGSGNPQALAVGSNNYVLTADSSETTGIKWAALTSAAIDGTANGSNNRIATYSSSTALNGEANLTFDGSALQCTGTLTVGSDGSGHDVTFFGDTAGAKMVWDESDDSLNLTASTGNRPFYISAADGNLHMRMTAADDHSNSIEFVNATGNAVYCGMFGDQTNGAGNFGIYNGGFHMYVTSDGTLQLPTANCYIANSPSGNTLIGSDANNQNIKIATGGSGNIELYAVNTGYAVRVHNDSGDGGKGIQCMAGVDSGADGGVNFQVATGNGTQVGLISWSNTTTTYATSSDYRLKENVVPLANALTRIDQFKPYNFNFKDNPDLLMDGFLAHEVDEILPYAVVGDKDAVNEDGTIDPQSMDSSHLIPLLVKAVQELSAKVTALENA